MCTDPTVFHTDVVIIGHELVICRKKMKEMMRLGVVGFSLVFVASLVG